MCVYHCSDCSTVIYVWSPRKFSGCLDLLGCYWACTAQWILLTSFSFSPPFSLNFKDPEAVRALTCTLLREDFGLSIDIPLERLIPTVPLRLNYIHWVEDLIGHQDSDKSTLRRGIDIGIRFLIFLWLNVSFINFPRSDSL